MTSYIVVCKDPKKRQEYLGELYQKYNISRYDLTIIDSDSTRNEQSIGVEDIKNLRQKIFLKPIDSKVKAVVLEDAHILTIEAQNALLKILEEPPDHTIIILSTESAEPLLSTILSRCLIVNLNSEPRGLVEFEPREKQEMESLINQLSEMKIGDRLEKAEKIAKDKDSALKWIEKIIWVLREKMLNEARGSRDTRGNRDTLQAMQSLHTLLKSTNANPRFAIENTLLNI